MALATQTFTRAGNPPDFFALAAGIRAVIGDPFYLAIQNGTVEVDKTSAWTGAQTTAVQTAVSACADATPQSDAQNAIDNLPIFQKAILLALLDQINVIRAALPVPLGAITPAQALGAVRAKAGTL